MVVITLLAMQEVAASVSMVARVAGNLAMPEAAAILIAARPIVSLVVAPTILPIAIIRHVPTKTTARASTVATLVVLATAVVLALVAVAALVLVAASVVVAHALAAVLVVADKMRFHLHLTDGPLVITI